MTTNQPDPKLIMAYPCVWEFKVIGSEPAALRAAAAEVFGDTPCTISLSNSSRAGKYHCLNLQVTVPDETTRNTFHHKLKRHAAVKLVL